MSKSATQGHGVYGRFGGLQDEWSQMETSKIILQPVPFDLTTTYQKGSDLGPAALIEASRNLELYDIETDYEVYKKGIHTSPSLVCTSSNQMREKLYHQTLSFIKNHKYVVTIGGEHSISYAPILAHAKKYPSMSILQIDAHADLAEAYEGDPWSHACIMARVREIPSISSIVSVGIRSMSYEESLRVDKHHTFLAHDLNLDPPTINKIIQPLSQEVYITFDLDCFDSSLMPSTGTPEPGGLFWNSTMQLLKQVALQREIVGFDVVELLPNPANVAPDFLAAKLVYKLLSYRFKPA